MTLDNIRQTIIGTFLTFIITCIILKIIVTYKKVNLNKMYIKESKEWLEKELLKDKI